MQEFGIEDPAGFAQRTPGDAAAAEQALPIEAMVDAAVQAASKEEFRYPVLK